MRLIFTLLLAFASLSLTQAQGDDGLLKSIGKKNLTLLESKLAKQVDFCIKDSQEKKASSVVISELQAFLEEVGAKSCRQVHLGDSKNGSYFRVGKLKTENGNFRVFIYYENNKVIEFRIDTY